MRSFTRALVQILALVACAGLGLIACEEDKESGPGSSDTIAESLADIALSDSSVDATEVTPEVAAETVPVDDTTDTADVSDIAEVPDSPDSEDPCLEVECFDCECDCGQPCGGCFSVCDEVPADILDCSCCETCDLPVDTSEAEDEEVVEVVEEVIGPDMGLCQGDDDCMVIDKKDCCPPPYVCHLAPLVGTEAEQDDVEAWKAVNCSPDFPCPDYSAPQCSDCLDLETFTPACVDEHCVALAELDCDALCAAWYKDPDEACPFISAPDLLTQANHDLCACVPPGPCDPISQEGCSTTQKCTIVDGEPSCAAAGSVDVGAACFGKEDCKPGLFCAVMGLCMHLCKEDAACVELGYEFCNKNIDNDTYGYCMVWL